MKFNTGCHPIKGKRERERGRERAQWDTFFFLKMQNEILHDAKYAYQQMLFKLLTSSPLHSSNSSCSPSNDTSSLPQQKCR